MSRPDTETLLTPKRQTPCETALMDSEAPRGARLLSFLLPPCTLLLGGLHHTPAAFTAISSLLGGRGAFPWQPVLRCNTLAPALCASVERPG